MRKFKSHWRVGMQIMMDIGILDNAAWMYFFYSSIILHTLPNSAQGRLKFSWLRLISLIRYAIKGVSGSSKTLQGPNPEKMEISGKKLVHRCRSEMSVLSGLHCTRTRALFIIWMVTDREPVYKRLTSRLQVGIRWAFGGQLVGN